MSWMALLVGLILFVLLLRAFLIVAGFYKDPVLRSFEVYGTETHYSPLLGLFLWSIAFFTYVSFLLFHSTVLYILFIFVIFPLLLFYQKLRDMVSEHPEWFMLYPRWLHKLRDRTSREERRRIAYLWLRLPARTRLIYNTQDDSFHKWVDLVLMTIA